MSASVEANRRELAITNGLHSVGVNTFNVNQVEQDSPFSLLFGYGAARARKKQIAAEERSKIAKIAADE